MSTGPVPITPQFGAALLKSLGLDEQWADLLELRFDSNDHSVRADVRFLLRWEQLQALGTAFLAHDLMPAAMRGE